MTTYNDQTTTRYERSDRRAADQQHRDADRKRYFVRSAALGATVAAVMFGGIFAATEIAHDNSKHTPVHHTANATVNLGSSAATQGAAGTPATTGGSSANTGGGSVPSGASVVALQKDLGQLNYYEDAVNGVYDAATKAAVEDFQRANGLTVDGIAGPQTMALIQKQLITGDSQMGGSGLPSKHTGGNSTNGGGSANGGSSSHGSNSGNGGSTNSGGGSSNTGGSSTGGSSSTGGAAVGA
jgi:hypothetical protein